MRCSNNDYIEIATCCAGFSRGASDSPTISFYAQGWYSLNDGASWTDLGDTIQVNNSDAESFAGLYRLSLDMSSASDLQSVTGAVRIALAVADNSTRNAYSESSIHPAAHHLDNINLHGTVDAENLVFEITALSTGGSVGEIEWESEEGMLYSLMSSAGLTPPAWTEEESGIVGLEGTTTHTASVNQVTRFFRINQD